MTSKFVPSEIKVNGKPIKKSYQNALTKAQATIIWKDKDAGVRANKFSGVVAQLTDLETSIFDWVMVWYALYERGQMVTPVTIFDNMRYLFLELNPDAYYDLLD